MYYKTTYSERTFFSICIKTFSHLYCFRRSRTILDHQKLLNIIYQRSQVTQFPHASSIVHAFRTISWTLKIIGNSWSKGNWVIETTDQTKLYPRILSKYEESNLPEHGGLITGNATSDWESLSSSSSWQWIRACTYNIGEWVPLRQDAETTGWIRPCGCAFHSSLSGSCTVGVHVVVAGLIIASVQWIHQRWPTITWAPWKIFPLRKKEL